jgi:hypothetical protein
VRRREPLQESGTSGKLPRALQRKLACGRSAFVVGLD